MDVFISKQSNFYFEGKPQGALKAFLSLISVPYYKYGKHFAFPNAHSSGPNSQTHEFAWSSFDNRTKPYHDFGFIWVYRAALVQGPCSGDSL